MAVDKMLCTVVKGRYQLATQQFCCTSFKHSSATNRAIWTYSYNNNSTKQLCRNMIPHSSDFFKSCHIHDAMMLISSIIHFFFASSTNFVQSSWRLDCSIVRQSKTKLDSQTFDMWDVSSITCKWSRRTWNEGIS